MCWGQIIYVKCGFDLNFYGNVDWSVGDGVGREVGAGFGRGIVDKVDSDVDDEVGEGLNYKLGLKLVMVIAGVVDDIVSWDSRSIGKVIKNWFNIRVVDSVGWDIERVIGSGDIIDVDKGVISGDNGKVK